MVQMSPLYSVRSETTVLVALQRKRMVLVVPSDKESIRASLLLDWNNDSLSECQPTASALFSYKLALQELGR